MEKEEEEVTVEQQRDKLAQDLVDLAIEWNTLKKGMSVSPGYLSNYVFLNSMFSEVVAFLTERAKKEQSDVEVVNEPSDAPSS